MDSSIRETHNPSGSRSVHLRRRFEQNKSKTRSLQGFVGSVSRSVQLPLHPIHQQSRHHSFLRALCKVITDFKRNPYGLPYIYSMYSIASTVYKAKYYGYLNSDILIEPVVFSVLNYLDKQARAGSISPYHELAGRVHPIDTTALPVGFSTLEEMEKCFAEAKEKGYELRNPCTAVCVSPYPHL